MDTFSEDEGNRIATWMYYVSCSGGWAVSGLGVLTLGF